MTKRKQANPRRNISRLILMAKPGEEIRVNVRVGDNTTATQLMEAVGALSNDGSPSLSWSQERVARSRRTTCAPELS